MTTTTNPSDGVLRSPFITKLPDKADALYRYTVRQPDGAQLYCVSAEQVLAAVFGDELPSGPISVLDMIAECEAAAYKDSRAFGQSAKWAAKVARKSGKAFEAGYSAKADAPHAPHTFSTTYEQEAYRDGFRAKWQRPSGAEQVTD